MKSIMRNLKVNKEETLDLHLQSVEILKKDVLPMMKKLFVLDNWQPGAIHPVKDLGALFYFFRIAHEFSIHVTSKKVMIFVPA